MKKAGLTILIIVLLVCCKKEKIPVVATTDITNVTEASALSGGRIIDDLGSLITARGVCWSAANNPTLKSDSMTVDGPGYGAFTSNITRLAGGTTYYVRAYATNRNGTGYGLAVSFKTNYSLVPGPPRATTGEATVGSANDVTLHGIVNANNSPTYINFEYGLSSGYGTISNNTGYSAGGNQDTEVGYLITSILAKGTTYHYRIIATNNLGTVYGLDRTFTTHD